MMFDPASKIPTSDTYTTTGKYTYMRVPSNLFKPGGVYHIYNHAVYESLLFNDDNDYRICVKLICEHYRSSEFAIPALCLMPNHYHLLIKQLGETPPQVFMNKVWFRYSKYYNKIHGRRGSIFAGKAQHKLVDNELYISHLTAYIHQNPVVAGLVETPGDWEWSNFREWAGTRTKLPFAPHLSDAYLKELDGLSDLMEDVSGNKEFTAYLLD